MVFHWSFSDSKSPQVSTTRLRILAVFSNAVVWIVSTRPPNSKSSRPFNNPLVIVSNAPITIGTIVTFMFHRFFNSLARSRYFNFLQIYSVVRRDSKVYNFVDSLFFFFLLIIMRSGLLTGIRWPVCIIIIIIIVILHLAIFQQKLWFIVFHWSDSTSSQVCRTLLSILGDLNNVWHQHMTSKGIDSYQ